MNVIRYKSESKSYKSGGKRIPRKSLIAEEAEGAEEAYQKRIPLVEQAHYVFIK